MKRMFLLILVLLLVMVALPASASGVGVSFDDAANSILTANTHTFEGDITSTFAPNELTYRYEVYHGNTGTPIVSSEFSSAIARDNWNYSSGTYTGEFSFTAQFGTYTGQMTVSLQVWRNGALVTSQPLQVYVQPLQVSLHQNNNLVISEQNYEFTGMVTSYTTNLGYPVCSYQVLNKDGQVITQSSQVTVTQVSTSSYLNTYTVRFNVNFGDYTGTARVTLTATDGTRTSTDTIAVKVESATTVQPSPAQYGEFKNRGQLISYLVKQLKVRGHGNHKNIGQALKYAVQHQDFKTITNTTKANAFLTEKVLNAAVITQKKGKRLCF